MTPATASACELVLAGTVPCLPCFESLNVEVEASTHSCVLCFPFRSLQQELFRDGSWLCITLKEARNLSAMDMNTQSSDTYVGAPWIYKQMHQRVQARIHKLVFTSETKIVLYARRCMHTLGQQANA